VHPASGYAVGFRPLAEALPARMPVWGLQARGLEPGETPHKSIAQMAEAYVAAIRSVQARGPYRLLGWSVGGTIAQEMACLIEQQGDSVSLLCVLDTPVVTESVHLKRPGNSAVDARAARHFRAQVVARGLLPPDTPDSWGSRVLEQMRLSRSLVEKHRPESCAAPVLLIRATREPGHAASFAWERLTSGPVARIDVPCLHTELGDAGHVPTIAAAVWERAGP
jgi:nonribosomal peptide synthetase CepC